MVDEYQCWYLYIYTVKTSKSNTYIKLICIHNIYIYTFLTDHEESPLDQKLCQVHLFNLTVSKIEVNGGPMYLLTTARP